MSGAKGKIYPEEFKRSAVALVKTSGQSLSHTARHVGEKRVVPLDGSHMLQLPVPQWIWQLK